MATAAEIATILSNLKSTYNTLAADAASAVTAQNRSITLKQLKEVREEISHWESQLALANAGGTVRPYVVGYQGVGG